MRIQNSEFRIQNGPSGPPAVVGPERISPPPCGSGEGVHKPSPWRLSRVLFFWILGSRF